MPRYILQQCYTKIHGDFMYFEFKDWLQTQLLLFSYSFSFTVNAIFSYPHFLGLLKTSAKPPINEGLMMFHFNPVNVAKSQFLHPCSWAAANSIHPFPSAAAGLRGAVTLGLLWVFQGFLFYSLHQYLFGDENKKDLYVWQLICCLYEN